MSWQVYKRISKKPIDIPLVPNVTIRCYPNGYSATHVNYCGLYDYDEMNFLLRYLRSEDSFLDVGANVGVYSLLAASIITSGEIYSIEALPKNFSRLEENLKLNNFEQVKTYAVAISDNQGEISLELAEGDSMPFISINPTQHSIPVTTNTLDNLLEQESVKKLTLAKIDIEGAELFAFKGAASLLSQKRPFVWILELNDTINHFDHSEQDVVSFLNQYGYHLYFYNADTNIVKPLSCHQKRGNNVLAISDDHLDFVHQRLNEVDSSTAVRLTENNLAD